MGRRSNYTSGEERWDREPRGAQKRLNRGGQFLPIVGGSLALVVSQSTVQPTKYTKLNTLQKLKTEEKRTNHRMAFLLASRIPEHGCQIYTYEAVVLGLV